MSEEYTCIECENLYDDTDGDTDERMCNKCLDKIYFEELKIKSKKQVKLAMIKVDKFIDWVKGEQRDPNIQRSSTTHYPDWDIKKKEYVVPPNQRRKQCPKCKSDHPVHTVKDLSDCNWHELKDGSTTIIPDPYQINEMNDAIKSTPEYKLGKKLLDGEMSNITIDNIIDKES